MGECRAKVFLLIAAETRVVGECFEEWQDVVARDVEERLQVADESATDRIARALCERDREQFRAAEQSEAFGLTSRRPTMLSSQSG